MRKKKILFVTDFSLISTGFAKNIYNTLKFLYSTNKYELIHLCCGVPDNNQDLSRTPWRSIGAIPSDPNILNQIGADPHAQRSVGYGALKIDAIIKQEKPDGIFLINDYWGMQGFHEKPWAKHINVVYWVTIDSLPIPEEPIKQAQSTPYYWVWSSFAEKEFHRLGHKHVITMPGMVQIDNFYRKPDFEKTELRKKHNIDKDKFIIGYVFRNQLRKLVPNLFAGVKLWKERNPEVKNIGLLLHTNFAENGWPIMQLAKQYEIPESEIYGTMVCRACRTYKLQNYKGENQDCPSCQQKGSMVSANVANGVSEQDLCEIYNIMDTSVSVHTSGGMEKPIFESKLCENITCVCSYSCGEQACEPEAFSLPLDYDYYTEFGTNFLKASVNPSSIAKQLQKIYSMEPKTQREWGRRAREWVIKGFSVDVVGQRIEKFIDELPPIKYQNTSPDLEPTEQLQEEARTKMFEKIFFNPAQTPKDPNAVIPQIEDNAAWVESLYEKILKRPSDAKGKNDWLESLKRGISRQKVEDFFRQTAAKDNNDTGKTVGIEDFLVKSGNKRLVLVLKESIGDIFLATSLLKSLREQYNEGWDIYFATSPQYFEILDGNPYITGTIPYHPNFESELFCTGVGGTKGLFDAYINLAVSTQRVTNYHTNNNIALELKDNN